MKQTAIFRNGTGFVGMYLFAASAGAQAPATAEVLIDAAACVEIETAIARLDCFDRLARQAVAETAAPAPSPTRAPAEPEPQTTAASEAESAPATSTVEPEESFGIVETRESDETREVEEIRSEVAELREIEPGRLLITLTNGQVWRQTVIDSYRLRVGHEVRIYQARFGQTFRLTAPEIRSAIRVERVR